MINKMKLAQNIQSHLQNISYYLILFILYYYNYYSLSAHVLFYYIHRRW